MFYYQQIASLVSALVIDKFGRRPLLIISQVLMTISLTTMGLFFFLKQNNDGVSPEGLDWLPLLSMGIFIFAFAFGTGPLAYTIQGEILPPEAKGTYVNIPVNLYDWIEINCAYFFKSNIFTCFRSWSQCYNHREMGGLLRDNSVFLWHHVNFGGSRGLLALCWVFTSWYSLRHILDSGNKWEDTGRNSTLLCSQELTKFFDQFTYLWYAYRLYNLGVNKFM